MPIQFTCSQCGQPIEVDNEHAGKTAACPYCQHLVAVPLESTFRPEAATTARPAGLPAIRPMEAAGAPDIAGPVFQQYGPPPIPPPRLRTATTLGAYALICALLAIGLFGASVTRALVKFNPLVNFSPTSQPTPEELGRWQEQLAADTWFSGLQFGGLFFALAGLVLGIIGLTQSARGNWRAVLATVLCGLFFLCICGGVLTTVLFMRGGLPVR